MSGERQLDKIEPGATVIGVDGATIGTVEAINGEGIRVAGHEVPAAAIERVDRDGVHLQLARTAFEAHQDPDSR